MGGSRAVWQYRGIDAPPLITSDLVVSPFQVEPPSDVTAIGAGTRYSSFIYVNIVCRCMFLRPLAGSAVARQFVTDELMAEAIADQFLACSSGGSHGRRRERKATGIVQTDHTTPHAQYRERSSSAAGPKLQGSIAESFHWGGGCGGLGGDLIKV